MIGARSEARPVPDRPVDRTLWIGLLAGPFFFLGDLLARYALVGPTCEAHEKTALHLVTLGALLAAAVPAGLAWRAWRRWDAGNRGEGGAGDTWREPARSRGRFLAMAVLGLGSLSVLAILAGEVPGLILGPCQ